MKSRFINIENAKIGFRNFAGLEGKFNKAGDRNFCIFLEADIAEQLLEDGFNVKFLKPRDEGDVEQAYLPVSVNYSNIAPKIVLITTGGKTILDEEFVSTLDHAEIDTVDIILNPYHWTVNGKSGIKTYVKAMYVTTVADEFEAKYYNVPDSAENCERDENGICVID